MTLSGNSLRQTGLVVPLQVGLLSSRSQPAVDGVQRGEGRPELQRSVHGGRGRLQAAPMRPRDRRRDAA